MQSPNQTPDLIGRLEMNGDTIHGHLRFRARVWRKIHSNAKMSTMLATAISTMNGSEASFNAMNALRATKSRKMAVTSITVLAPISFLR